MSVVAKVYKNKRGDIYTVVCDDCKFPVNTRILSQTAVSQGDDLTQEMSEDLAVEFLKDYLEEKAANLVSIRARSEKEIRDYFYKQRVKLKKKFLENIDVNWDYIADQVVMKFHDIGLLDDADFARQFVEARIAMRPRSVYMMKMELLKKGVDSDVADRVLDELVDDETELARAVLEKKFKQVSLSRKDTKKITFLQRKGFNWDVISKLVEDD
ncbi:hypothetical protein GF357_05155 [Candidatus Dojkabacteria bacterium]|nr:hypothetical protein [Candidatus Dojkabacteria bacterium]